MNKTFKVNYLARDFQSIKEELKQYTKRYYSDKFADLSEASINSLMIDSVAYVGDVLSYYLDYQTNESMLATAVETNNIQALAKELGYKQKTSNTTTGIVAIYLLIPASSDGSAPDFSKAPIIKKGTVVRSSDNTKSFLTTEDIIIDTSLIGSNYVVARVNNSGTATYYAVKVYASIISGEIISSTLSVGTFKSFNKVFLDDSTAVEIISVFDADGNEYYEVPSLSQNIVYKSFLNKDDPSSNVRYILKPVSAIRRFVFDYDNLAPYMLFGAKQYKPDEDLSVDPIAEPSKFILQKYNNDFLQNDYFEPNALLNGDTFGIGPDNTTLTVLYRRNSTFVNNATSGEITSVSDLKYEFLDKTLTSDVINTIISSVQVINEEPITGESSIPEIDEIRDLAGIVYQSQNRAVTAKDYEALCYMMSAKYGSLKRVKAERDANSIKNNINIYVISQDIDGSLLAANSKNKENLKTWLSSYKMLTDTVDILDAKIINIGIEYTILADPNLNKTEVLTTTKEQLKFVFSQKAQIGEPINKLDILREIRKVKGVLDIRGDIVIKTITSTGYSQVPFNIKQNTTPDGNMVIIPRNAIYEIKDTDLDIQGRVI